MQTWLSDEIFDKTKERRNAVSVLGELCLVSEQHSYSGIKQQNKNLYLNREILIASLDHKNSNVFPVQIFHLERLVWQVVVGGGVEAHLCLQSRLSSCCSCSSCCSAAPLSRNLQLCSDVGHISGCQSHNRH